nr:zinc finger BED domain-containing protein RICESLEEPER 2-like [Ipomoea batatas]
MNFDCDGTIRSKNLDTGLAREVFAAAIVEHDCPFAFVEYPGFRKYHKLLNLDDPMISRNTLVSDINKLYLKEKNKLKQVLTIILEQPCYEMKFYQDLDVLNYWKGRVQGYPILSCMARDLLAIPITTVTSESAFSIGARVLTKYRSCLLPEKVQTLIYTRNWLHGFNMDDDDVDEDNNGDEGDDMNEDELNDGMSCRLLGVFLARTMDSRKSARKAGKSTERRSSIRLAERARLEKLRARRAAHSSHKVGDSSNYPLVVESDKEGWSR